MFRESYFGQFLDLEVHKYKSTLKHCVLFCQVRIGVLGEVFWFRLIKIDCRFGLIEFTMITELKFSKKMDISDYVTTRRA